MLYRPRLLSNRAAQTQQTSLWMSENTAQTHSKAKVARVNVACFTWQHDTGTAHSCEHFP